MRLRITVQRHGLPPTSILWRVPEHPNPEYYTIAGLLEDINHVLPLEALEWGLEDYVVLVGRFECVHFDSVRLLLKDEDEVIIRALSTNDIRARRLGGRYQISENGQHLVDGIPFGRPLLRWPHRPQIRIPPRKRQRMLDESGDVETGPPPAIDGFHKELEHRSGEDAPSTHLITSNGEPPEVNGSHSSIEREAADHSEPSLSGRIKSRIKSVQFGQLPNTETDSDEDDDEDFEFDEEGLSSDDKSDDSSSRESSPTSSEASVSSSSDDDTDTDSDTSSRESGDDSESSESAGPDILSSKPPVVHVSAPGKGQSITKRRNQRRRLTKKLRQLKESGKLHADATWKDLPTHLHHSRMESKQQDTGTKGSIDSTATPSGEFGSTLRTVSTATTNTRKRKHTEQTLVSEGTTEIPGSANHSDLENRKRDLVHQLEQGPSPTEAPTAESARKRLKPDVAAIGRILGRQTRPLSKSPKSEAPVEFAESPTPVDPDFYKSRINVSAFETYHSGYSLGPPPFPFQQHWDPASETMQSIDRADRKKNGKKSKYKDSSYTAAHEAPQSASNTAQDPGGLVLDYGEASSLDMDSNTAIEDQIRQDVATATTQKSDLPALPDKPEGLPELSPADAKPGAIIAFKYLAFDQASPMPELSDFVTGRIEESEPDQPMHIKLAQRDRTKLYKEGKIDKEGNPTFGGVDVFLSDEEVMMFMEFPLLHEARLLAASND